MYLFVCFVLVYFDTGFAFGFVPGLLFCQFFCLALILSPVISGSYKEGKLSMRTPENKDTPLVHAVLHLSFLW